MATWIKFQDSNKWTNVIDLDHAVGFTLVKDGHLVICLPGWAENPRVGILKKDNPEAYQQALNYINSTTGYNLP